MTCKEKLRLEHPDWSIDEINHTICVWCPSDYDYLRDPDCCSPTRILDNPNMSCAECWNREIPGTNSSLVDEDDNELSADYYKNTREVNEAMEKAQRTKTKIITISGKAQNGKDTTAQFLKEALESKGKKVLITHYGDLVKYVCKTFFDWNGEKDEAGRTLLQYIGTDVIRAQTPNYWVDFVLSILKHFPDTWDYILIPDCRFPNELDCVKDAGWDMMHVRVIRSGNGFVSPLTEEQQNHISETALDKVLPNCIVMNRGTLDDLRDYVYELAGYLEGK